MKKYLLTLYLVAVASLILVFAATFVSAQSSIISAVTPDTNTSWQAGTTQNVTWGNTVPFTVCTTNLLSLGLFALDANGAVIYRTDTNGGYIYDYSGAATNPTSGTISLPANAIPRQYKVVVRCQNLGLIEGVSAGVVTISNPSFQPLILISPTTPVTYTAGVDASGVGIHIRVADVAVSLLPAGTPVTIKLIKKSDQSVVWQKADSLTSVGSPYPYLSSGINSEDVSTIPVGTYFFRDEMQAANGQNYSIDSADLIFTAPPPSQPPTYSLSITKAGTGSGTVTSSPAGIECGADCSELYNSGTLVTLTASPARGSTFTGFSGDCSGTKSLCQVKMSATKSVTATFNTTAPAPAASITITTPKADGTTVWQSNVANNITWTSTGIVGDVVIQRFASTGGAALATVTTENDDVYTVPANVLPAGSYYYTISGNPEEGSGVITSPQSGDFTVTAGDGPPPHRSWAPPFYSPPKCDGDRGFDPGCYPPINVSTEPQTKTGPLTVGSLIVDGGAFIRGVLKLPFGIGDADIGKVLTLTAADGTAAWRPGGGPGGTPDNYSCPDGQSIGTISNGSVTRCEPDDTGAGGPTDPNVWQKRVSSTCAAGSSIRVIDVNGGVTCEEDNTTTDTGSGDITSVKSSGAKSGLTIKNSAIVDGDAVGGEVLSGDAIISLRRDCAAGQILKWNGGWNCDTDNSGGGLRTDCAAGEILQWFGSPTNQWKCATNLYTTANTGGGLDGILNTSIPSNLLLSIKDGGVTSAKIADGAVTAAKIVNGAVANNKTDFAFSSFVKNTPGTLSLGSQRACFLQGVISDSFTSGYTSGCRVYPAGEANNAGNYPMSANQNWTLEVYRAFDCRAICLN